MKLSEFIDRLLQLQRVHGGDPDVAIDADSSDQQGVTYYESANANLQYVTLLTDADQPFPWKSERNMPPDSPQVVVVF